MKQTLDDNGKLLLVERRNSKRCPKCQFFASLLIIFLGSFGVLFLFNALPHLTSKGDFQIVSASSYELKEGIAINANLTMNFPDAVVEALENGIPLTIAVEAQVLRERPWWRNIMIKDSRKLFELRYHPLTNVHEVKNIATDERYSFNSRQDAMAVLGTIRGAHLIENKELIKNNQYIAQMRIMLDISHLPPELRQVASLSSSWRLESAWYRWNIFNNSKAQEKVAAVEKMDLLPALNQRATLLVPIEGKAANSDFKEHDFKDPELKERELKDPDLKEQR